jgi:succinate dehydrogenase/fumarate reductase flavoprotein subunit
VWITEKHTEFWSRNHLTEATWMTCVDGRIVKRALKKERERDVGWIHLILDRSWLAVLTIDKPCISTKYKKVLDELRNYLLANLHTYPIPAFPYKRFVMAYGVAHMH